MKKTSVIALILLITASFALAGGIVTNTNQSAEFLRTLNRNASTSVDAAYFNPAGITKLEDGTHLSISNQSIFQTRTIESANTSFNEDTFEGTVDAFLFPDLHVVHKMGQMAFSGSFMVIGGGGGADFPKGLPATEQLVSVLATTTPVVGMAPYGVNGYTVDANFEASSVYYGMQVGGAYEVNEMASVSLGLRYIMAKNTYNGYIKDIMVTSAIPGLEGPLTPGDYIRGLTSDPASATAAYLDVATADVVVEDATKTGSGMSIILGANLVPMEGVNVGIRFETAASMELETETETEVPGVLVDGETEGADMPAFLGLGASYVINPQLTAEGSFNYYMNTGVNWYDDAGDTLATGVQIDAADRLYNGWEAGISAAYKVNDQLTASAGFLMAKSGAKNNYQSSLSYSLPSNSIAVGVKYNLKPGLDLNVGLTNTMYDDRINASTPQETYKKTSLAIGFGINYTL